MATPYPQLNPMAVTNGAGLFQLQSEGMVQGFMQPDPATRNALAQGIVDANASVVLWGGEAVALNIAGSKGLGPIVSKATTAATIQGFVVTNQAANGITTPSSAPPSYGSNMSVQFLRLGSGARLTVGIEPTFAASISAGGSPETVAASWDFTNQRIVAPLPTESTITLSAITWTAGVATATASANTLVTGDIVTIVGSTPTGYNGTVTVTVVDSTHFTYPIASNPGTYTSGAQINPTTATATIPVQIIRVNVGNSQTIVPPDGNNNLAWNPNGSCAEIII